MKTISKDQILDQIENIITHSEVPYFEVEGGELYVYLGTQKEFIVSGVGNDAEEIKALILNIASDYHKRALTTLDRISKHFNTEQFVFRVNRKTGEIHAGGFPITRAYHSPFTYPTIHHFNWLCGAPDDTDLV